MTTHLCWLAKSRSHEELYGRRPHSASRSPQPSARLPEPPQQRVNVLRSHGSIMQMLEDDQEEVLHIEEDPSLRRSITRTLSNDEMSTCLLFPLQLSNVTDIAFSLRCQHRSSWYRSKEGSECSAFSSRGSRYDYASRITACCGLTRIPRIWTQAVCFSSSLSWSDVDSAQTGSGGRPFPYQHSTRCTILSSQRNPSHIWQQAPTGLRTVFSKSRQEAGHPRITHTHFLLDQ